MEEYEHFIISCVNILILHDKIKQQKCCIYGFVLKTCTMKQIDIKTYIILLKVNLMRLIRTIAIFLCMHCQSIQTQYSSKQDVFCCMFFCFFLLFFLIKNLPESKTTGSFFFLYFCCINTYVVDNLLETFL